MDWQLLIAVFLGLAAGFYLLKRIGKPWLASRKQKACCGDCSCQV
jgi:hypothetical protein